MYMPSALSRFASASGYFGSNLLKTLASTSPTAAPSPPPPPTIPPSQSRPLSVSWRHGLSDSGPANELIKTLSTSLELKDFPSVPSNLVTCECKRKLKDLLMQKDNRFCADCGAADPKWALANIGVFICLKCCGVQRSLDTHISKVLSVTLDEWSDDEIDAMIEVGGNSSDIRRSCAQKTLSKTYVLFVAYRIGCVVCYTPVKRGFTTSTLNYVVNQADTTVGQLRNASDYLAAAWSGSSLFTC